MSSAGAHIPATGLRPGMAIRAELPGAERASIHARVRQWVDGEYLELHVSHTLLPEAACEPGAPWLLRYVGDNCAITATSRFLGYAAHPLDGVRLTSPEHVSTHAARVYKRLARHDAVVYQVAAAEEAAPGAWVRAVLHDLSLGGCAFWTTEPLAADTRLRVALHGEANRESLQVEATVRHARSEESGFLVGVEFEHLTKDQRAALVRLLGEKGLAADPLVIHDE